MCIKMFKDNENEDNILGEGNKIWMTNYFIENK